jgi:hypothetical protein
MSQDWVKETQKVNQTTPKQAIKIKIQFLNRFPINKDLITHPLM